MALFSCVVLGVLFSLQYADCNASPFLNEPQSEDEDVFDLKSSFEIRADHELPGFKYLYLDEDGHVNDTLNPSVVQLEIAGSPLCSELAMQIAADDLIKMTKYMPRDIFRNVARGSTVGIFSAQEKIIVFPEYANYANGDCGSSCLGPCAHTCTNDGRKWETIAGIGGKRAAILEDNILCNSNDPYYHYLSVLVHEFTHTIHAYGLDAPTKHSITAAFGAAKASGTWDVHSYAMSNEREYLAVATTVFFGVNLNGLSNSGGMNNCGGGTMCSTESSGRAHLKAKDPALFNVLSFVFTSNIPELLSSLTTCPAVDFTDVVVG